jgi:hypothetical protein
LMILRQCRRSQLTGGWVLTHGVAAAGHFCMNTQNMMAQGPLIGCSHGLVLGTL